MSSNIVHLANVLVVSSLTGVLGVSAVSLPVFSQSYPVPLYPDTSGVITNSNSTIILPNGTIIIPNSQPVNPDAQPSFNSTETTIEVFPTDSYGGYGSYHHYPSHDGYGSYYNYGRYGGGSYYNYGRRGENPYYNYHSYGNYGPYYDRREPQSCSNIILGSPIGSPIPVTPTGQACH